MDQVRIGCGSASSLDPLDFAIELGNSGQVSYLSFDCLSERTLTLAQLRRQADPAAGQDPRLPEAIVELEPFLRSGGTIVGNFGAANPPAATRDALDALGKAGLQGTNVGTIGGDDVREEVLRSDLPLPSLGVTAREVEHRLIAAHAYVGADPIVALLAQGAQVVIGGRLADPSMYVAPLAYELGWALDDWDRMGAATLVGHLLETGVYTTGGCFADPPLRVVPDAHHLGLPMAEVDADGGIVITKLDGTGGMVDRNTVRAMLAYEIHDPAAYVTPDVVADFTQVTAIQEGKDRVRMAGASGRPRPDSYKVLIGLDRGFKVVGELSLAGAGCLERADEAVTVHRKRVERWDDAIEDYRSDLMGHTSLWRGQLAGAYPSEVRLRITARTFDRSVAEHIAREFEYLMLVGPAGAGGATSQVTPALGVVPAYLDRDRVELTTEVTVA